MKTLVFGGGDLGQVYQRGRNDIILAPKAACDAADYLSVAGFMEEYRPDRVLCTAGLSDLAAGVTMQEVLDANLVAPMNVGRLAAAFHTPCVLVASTAGIVPGNHVWYGPAKAGVINYVRAMASYGERIWAVSPGRMDTKMRDIDWPDEDKATRVAPWVVGIAIDNCFDGDYAPGANVIVRKVGTRGRVDIYEEAAPCLPSLL